jgi:hypothetical protein
VTRSERYAIARRRVSKGFRLLDAHRPGFWHRVNPEEIRRPEDVLRLWRDRQALLELFSGRYPSETDLIAHGFTRGLLGPDPVYEWRRQIRAAQRTGVVKPKDGDPLTCEQCGAPRWDDETVSWINGKPYCDLCRPRPT